MHRRAGNHTEQNDRTGSVVRQDLVDGQAGLGQLALGLAVHDAAGGVGGAVRPVGAQREDQGVLHTGDPLGGRQGQLLIAAAQALSGEKDHRFASRQKGQGAPLLPGRSLPPGPGSRAGQ